MIVITQHEDLITKVSLTYAIPLQCLYVLSYKSDYYDPRAPLYLMDVIYPWLTGWIKDSFPTMYSRCTPLFDVQDDLTPLIADHFIAVKGWYAYKF